jgi:hypothetical protein
MNTSTTRALSKPTGDERIQNGVLDYINTRNQLSLFSVVQTEFIKSGIKEIDLAHRMGRSAPQICNLLGSPGNWTANTASTLIFAISGGVLNYSVSYPLDEPPRNLHTPEWLTSHTAKWISAAGNVPPANFGVGGTASTSSGTAMVSVSAITETL